MPQFSTDAMTWFDLRDKPCHFASEAETIAQNFENVASKVSTLPVGILPKTKAK